MGTDGTTHPGGPRTLALVGAMLLLAAALIVPGGLSARASSLGALTVVASGGEASTSGKWSYDAVTGVLSVTAVVSIDAADLVALLEARDLTVEALSITVNAAVVAAAGSHDLVLRSRQDITVSPGARLETLGGDIVLWADSAGDLTNASRAGGGIRIGADTATAACPSTVGAVAVLASNGGDIVLSGGDVADIAALRSSGFASYRVGMTCAHSEYFYAVGIFNASLDAGVGAGPGGGSIVVRGNARSFTGMIWTVQVGGAYGSTTTLRTTGPGVVEVVGDAGDTLNANPGAACGGSHPSRNPWGIALTGRVTSGQGAITLTGISTVLRPGPRGHSISGTVESESGPITIIDATVPVSPAVVPCSGATATDSNGPFISDAQLGRGALAGSASDVTIIADRVFFNGAAQVATTGTFTYAPRGASIQFVNDAATWSYPFPNLTSSSIGALTIGKPGNVSDVRIGANVPHIPGPIRLYGSTIDIDGTLSTADALELYTDAAVSQSAPITVADLRASGAGSFTLLNTGNVIGSVAGGSTGARLGSLRVVDSAGGLTVGIVGGDGVAASGRILIETLLGDITIVADLDTASTGDDAVRVNAGAIQAVGDATGGDIILVGSRTISTGAGGVARFYSGSDTASTGLTALVGGAGNARIGVNRDTAVFDPPLVAGGRYALYRSLGLVGGTGDPGGGGGQVPTLRLFCDPDPVGPGRSTTCDIEGAAPSVDILWEASIDGDAFAGQGVRTGPDGTATFTFRAPAGSSGRTILVSLVGWDVATSVAVVAGGPVPARIDAGSGSPSATLLWPAALLLLAGRMRRTGRAVR
jgi:hypothetical protein